VSFHDLITGPWGAVLVLGVTQILAWGAIFYPPVLTVPLIAADRGWTMSFAMGGFSLALLCAGIVSSRVGFLIDRYGGHRVMAIGALIGALGLVALVHAHDRIAYVSAWALIGVATAASLYDAAFSTLGRIFGMAARRPITALTLAGGLASTVSWPCTHFLIANVGWQGTYFVYAALLAAVAAPLYAFALPRARAAAALPEPGAAKLPIAVLAPKGRSFILVAASFAAYAFVPSGLSAHLLAIFGRAGIDPATAVSIGALFGPSQVTARIGEFLFARRLHPLAVARIAVGTLLFAFGLYALFGVSVFIAAMFMILFGAANGLVTIARGAVPLALFGAKGYGHIMGRIGSASLIMQAIAPFALAFAVERGSDATLLVIVAGFAMLSFIGLAAIRPPGAG
jgi:hypothetical protein